MAGSRIKGYHGRDRWRYYQASECLKGCQFRNQEYAESAQGCREKLLKLDPGNIELLPRSRTVLSLSSTR